MATNFGSRLQERVRALGPLCVGIDLSTTTLTSWRRSDDVAGLEFAALAMLEAVGDVAAAIKPQVAFFERFGSEGFVVLERLIAEARDLGVLIIADAKRGDIGSTNEGYAQAWLEDRSPLAVDALTVNPYLGLGALSSLFASADSSGRGLFVVVASSNDGGRAIQAARADTGELVEDLLLRLVAERNESAEGLGSIGAVIGATRERPKFDLAQVRGPFLVPGVGAQGATANQVAQLFARCPANSVLINVSRAVSDAGPDRRALRDAAQRWRDDLSAALA